jgi:hypothetical protein
MSLYTRLRALLPNPPLILARVVSRDEIAGTSLLTIPGGVPSSSLSPQVSTGATFTARGTGVELDKLALVRNGVIESQAPDGAIVEAVIGVVSPNPDGLAELALVGEIPDQTATVGVPFAFTVVPYFTGGVPPVLFALESGVIPAGLEGNALEGTITGIPTTAGVATLVVSLSDSTGAIVIAEPFNLTVNP